MARLYADENFPLGVVEELRTLGHDVLTTNEAGKSGQGIPDEEVLAFAHGLGRCVLTCNRNDFRFLHRKDPDHSGIIACTEDRDWPGQAARITAAIAENGNLAGKLIRVYRPNPKR